MGNPDLIIIINKEKVIEILGKDYDIRADAIRMAMNKFAIYIYKLKKIAAYPEEINDEIFKIEVYPK